MFFFFFTFIGDRVFIGAVITVELSESHFPWLRNETVGSEDIAQLLG